MDENNFIFPTSAQFYEKGTNLSKRLVTCLFQKLSEHRKGNYIYRKIRKADQKTDTVYSLMSFKYEDKPNFLINSSEVEIKYAMILIIEYKNYLVIFQKNISNTELLYSILNYSELPLDYFLHFQAHNSPAYNRMATNSMNMGPNVIFKRSYESLGDLEKSLSPAITSRSILNQFAFKIENIWTVTPSTNRIREQRSSIDIIEVINWSKMVCDQFSTNHISSFIKKFAKKVDLESIVKDDNKKVIAVFIDLIELEKLVRSSNVTISYKENILQQDKIDRLFNFFKKVIKIKDGKYSKYGSIKINKKNNYY